MKKVILTSDDFGLSEIYNTKIIEQIESNKLTSVSTMVDKVTPSQQIQIQKLKALKNSNNISLGLHLELTNDNTSLELVRQWDKFFEIFQIEPNYVDIHKGSEFQGSFDDIASFCNLKDVPFRKYKNTKIKVRSPDNSITATRYNIEELNKLIENLKDETVYEFVFHIGVFDPNSKSTFNKERELDIEKLNFVIKNLANKSATIISYNDI